MTYLVSEKIVIKPGTLPVFRDNQSLLQKCIESIEALGLNLFFVNFDKALEVFINSVVSNVPTVNLGSSAQGLRWDERVTVDLKFIGFLFGKEKPSDSIESYCINNLIITYAVVFGLKPNKVNIVSTNYDNVNST